jgi:uncharacterized protein involved in exopolysaccharide biosynthesis
VTPYASTASIGRDVPSGISRAPRWVHRTRLLWEERRFLARVTLISFVTSLAIAFLIPKQYKSTATIMPPDQQGTAAMMLAALSRSSSLNLLSSLSGMHASTELFIDLLRSGTVSNHLIDRFNLQHAYHKRYRTDAGKHLARITKITENKKSGVITIQVEDTDRQRARDLAQGYLDELNKLVMSTSTSAAHRERVFVEERLHSVQASLQDAEQQLSQFSSRSSAFDIHEQTRAMVDAGARLQAELLVEQSGLQSLRQIYGDNNIRVVQSQARIATLQNELIKMKGTAADAGAASSPAALSYNETALYPPLKQLPALGVSYADLYRRVKVQEAVFDLLTQQYELARIEEAKDVPPVNVIDAPGLAEKKSFPPRTILTLLLTFLCFVSASIYVLLRNHWSSVEETDPRKELAGDVLPVLRRRFLKAVSLGRGAI